MIKATLQSKLFIRVWLWSLVWGVVLGVAITYLLSALTLNTNGGDDMAAGFVALIYLFGIGNLVSYIAAIIVGKRFVQSQQQDVRAYLKSVIPWSLGAYLLSVIILYPLLLAGSLIAAFIVTNAIGKINSGEGAPAPRPPEAPVIDPGTKMLQ